MAKIEFDTKDRHILNILQSNSRITNSELAEAISLSPSSCLRRVQRLEGSGIIEGSVTMLNQEKAGKPMNVFVEISLGSQNESALDAFEQAIHSCPEIMECYLMSGDSDFLLRLVVEDVGDYERIHRHQLSNFPGVSRIRSNFSLRTVRKKTNLPM